MFKIKASLSANEAVKVDALCARILGDLGSIHARVNANEDGSAKPMSPEMVQMRRFVRELSDQMREQFPTAFFK